MNNGYEKDLGNIKRLEGCKLDLLDALRSEQQMLLEKMKENMENGNIGTYKNLVLALKEITYLIHQEEWTQKWSKYSCDDKDYVAIWEQKGSEVKNHKIFEIKTKDSCEKMYVDVGEVTYVYYQGEMITLNGTRDIEYVAHQIMQLSEKNKDLPIYIDVRAFGMSLYETLKNKGYNVFKTENLNIKIN